MVKFGYSITYVDDVEKTLTFFEQAFGFERRFLHESKGYGELNTGETILAFASISLGKTNLPEGFIATDPKDKPLGHEIALVAEDVTKIHNDALALGATELTQPEEKPWGQVVSYVRTPNGILLELCTPM